MYFSRIKDLRNDKDLTQECIAGLLFTSRNAYSNYERGTRTLPIEYLLILSNFYNVSTDYILGKTNIKMPYK